MLKQRETLTVAFCLWQTACNTRLIELIQQNTKNSCSTVTISVSHASKKSHIKTSTAFQITAKALKSDLVAHTKTHLFMGSLL